MSRRAQRKTIIQTQFVSVVSKVISDGIFNARFLKIKKVGKIKKRKKRALNKKKTFLHLWLWPIEYVSAYMTTIR